MDEVVGGFGYPDFGFPGNLAYEGLHGFARLEGGHEDEAGGAAFEELFQLGAALTIHGTGARDGFDEDEPVALHVVDDEVGHLGGGVQGDAELGQVGGVEVGEFSFGVGHVGDDAAGQELGGKELDHGFDQQAPSEAGVIEIRSIR